jgi:hypothetical protein
MHDYSLHDPLHYPRERRVPLLENDVEMVRHYDASEQRMTECRYGGGDIVCDLRADCRREEFRAVLGSRGHVEPGVWEI